MYRFYIKSEKILSLKERMRNELLKTATRKKKKVHICEYIHMSENDDGDSDDVIVVLLLFLLSPSSSLLLVRSLREFDYLCAFELVFCVLLLLLFSLS